MRAPPFPKIYRTNVVYEGSLAQWRARFAAKCAISSVAGVGAPAFVERTIAGWVTTLWWGVSPGWEPRPSLSGAQRREGRDHTACVAGVGAPAFVERGWPPICGTSPGPCRRGGSPGLR